MVAKIAYNTRTDRYHLVGTEDSDSTVILVDYGELEPGNTNDNLPNFELLDII